MVGSMDNSMHSTGSHSPFRRRLSVKVPPPRPRFERSGSEHMLPTSSLSPNKCVFSSKHRLIKRNLPFWQSKNKLQVTNQHSELRLFSLLKYDWFHVGLRINLWLSLFILLSIWTIAIIIWAGVYMSIDRRQYNADCGLGPPGEPIQFSPAFAFSLETCTTVGYGLPNGSNSFFEGECGGVQAAIYFQMVWSMMFNAFLFAFFFSRLAKCEARGVQVIFSNKAIISHRPDVPFPCFQFRVFDIDGSYPVVEAHVRIYLVTQKSPIPIPLRVVIPNDDYGSMLLLSLPSQVVHAMDAYSPMVPPTKVKCATSATIPGDGLHLRQVDGSTNSRDDVLCPVCGECYGTVERLIKHGKYSKMVESHDEYPVEGSHQEIDWDELEELLTKSSTWTLQQLEVFFRSNLSEVLCIVEGIDPLASGTFQAIHSYQVQDINFGEAHFADCVCLNLKQELVVDLDFFHQIRPNVPTVDSERSSQPTGFITKDKENPTKEPTTTTPEKSIVESPQSSLSGAAYMDTEEPLAQSPTREQQPIPLSVQHPEQRQVSEQQPFWAQKRQEDEDKLQNARQGLKTVPTNDDIPTKPEDQSTLVDARQSLRHVPTPPDLKELEDEGFQLEPRNLMFSQPKAQNLTPVYSASDRPWLPPAAQQTSPPLKSPFLPPTPAQPQPQLPPALTPAPAPVPQGLIAQAMKSPTPNPTPAKAVPHHKPRHYTSPVSDYESPPPLFVLDDDLATGESQPAGRASMPANMMGSLATGKFD